MAKSLSDIFTKCMLSISLTRRTASPLTVRLRHALTQFTFWFSSGSFPPFTVGSFLDRYESVKHYFCQVNLNKNYEVVPSTVLSCMIIMTLENSLWLVATYHALFTLNSCKLGHCNLLYGNRNHSCVCRKSLDATVDHQNIGGQDAVHMGEEEYDDPVPEPAPN
jgi:hypothetical protein